MQNHSTCKETLFLFLFYSVISIICQITEPNTCIVIFYSFHLKMHKNLKREEFITSVEFQNFAYYCTSSLPVLTIPSNSPYLDPSHNAPQPGGVIILIKNTQSFLFQEVWRRSAMIP